MHIYIKLIKSVILMTMNKKTFGISFLIIGILLLILGVFAVNLSAVELDLVYIVGFLAPGALILVAGIILLALYLHSAT